MTVTTCILQDDDDVLHVTGYVRDRRKEILTALLVVLSLGSLLLIFYWKPAWKLKFMCSVTDLNSAKIVEIKDQYKQRYVAVIRKIDNSKVSCNIDQSTGSTAVEFESFDDDTAILLPSSYIQYFKNKKIKYFWNNISEKFERLRCFGESQKCSFFHKLKGLSKKQQTYRRSVFGENSIAVHITPVVTLYLTQALNPFYIFQAVSCILWYIDGYTLFATCIVLISVISLTLQVYETRTMQRALKETIVTAEVSNVLRGGRHTEYETIPSTDLVPGDIVEIPRSKFVMTCDAVLINGVCVVNESMLTGESVPVLKTPVPDFDIDDDSPGSIFSLKEHSRHVLFCGTEILQARYYGTQKIHAVVARTGFMTAKGGLVRSILYPKPLDIKFIRDSYKFIVCLACVACVGMIYSVSVKILGNEPVHTLLIRTLDLITIVIPPTLPAAMTVGIVFAQKRLKRTLIYCISPKNINVCGTLDVVCFDKTGTLTEDGLDFCCCLPAAQGNFLKELQNTSTLQQNDPILVAMATCHSLTLVEGELTGDPLDLIIFKATNWDLFEPETTESVNEFVPTIVQPKRFNNSNQSPIDFIDKHSQDDYEVGIIRQFVFSSALQRMSVVVRQLGSDHFDLYAKGSPEMIVSLSIPSTVPADFQEILTRYTEQGLRIVALAHRQLSNISYAKVQRTQRDHLENNLCFLGLVVMENKLKSKTKSVIDMLHRANMRTIMVTGDNVLTALTVARKCNMIRQNDNVVILSAVASSKSLTESNLKTNWCTQYETEQNSNSKFKNFASTYFSNSTQHFVITGKSWSEFRKNSPELIPKIAMNGTIFARFAPEQKQQLVEDLQKVGYSVGMCGDGANDCGALKCAHAGISLSEAEASVAAPFTSKVHDISCVPSVIREGRAALVTSFGIFKYMACYSLTQFMSVCILYWIEANITDLEFLYIDLLLLTSLGITFCYTTAYPSLAPEPPQISLVSALPILSIAFQLILNLLTQVFAWQYVRAQTWFERFVLPPPDLRSYISHEVTVVFAVSSFQYIILAVVFSKGSPYRKSMFSNYPFILNLFAVTALTVYIVVYPCSYVVDYMELKPPPSIIFRLILVGVSFTNFLACLLLEIYVIDGFLHKHLTRRKYRKVRGGSKCAELGNEDEDQNFPSQYCFTSASLVLKLESEASVTL